MKIYREGDRTIISLSEHEARTVWLLLFAATTVPEGDDPRVSLDTLYQAFGGGADLSANPADDEAEEPADGR